MVGKMTSLVVGLVEFFGWMTSASNTHVLNSAIYLWNEVFAGVLGISRLSQMDEPENRSVGSGAQSPRIH